MENKKLYEDINQIVNARTQRIDEEILEEGRLAGKLKNAVVGIMMLAGLGTSPAELKAEAPKTTEVGKEAGKKDDRADIFKKVMLIPDDDVRLTRSGVSKNEQTKDLVEIVQIKINNKFVYGFKDYYDYRKGNKIRLIIPDPTTEDYVTEYNQFKLKGGRDFWTLRGGFKANGPIFKKYTSIVQKLNKK
jgi:hypothetical protein